MPGICPLVHEGSQCLVDSASAMASSCGEREMTSVFDLFGYGVVHQLPMTGRWAAVRLFMLRLRESAGYES